jgi:Spy/CpxP family protein refolding chaperone
MKVTRISLLAALLAGAICAAVPAAHAQETKERKETPKREGRGGGAEAMKERLDKLAADLKLTEDQKKKVGEALKAQTEKMRELRGQGGTPEDNREKFRALREETDKKLKEILTAEQYAKWEKERPQGRGKDGSGKRGEKKAEKN